jgi:endonuclease/exonuclease/phosphatase family metal-dependent hydrolase
VWLLIIVLALWHFGFERVTQAQAPTDAAAYWKLDETSGTTAADSSGNGHNGTLTNGPAWTTAGTIGGALTFDGVDDHVEVASPSALLQPTGAFAISAWIKYTATDTSGSSEVATMGNSYGLRVRSTGEVSAYFASGPAAWNFATTTGAGLNDGTWHHVVGQYTGSALQVYVDGVFAQQELFSGPIAYGLGTSFYLGQHNNSTNYNFAGTLDQVRVYGRALTATEVSALTAESPAFSFSHWKLDEGSGTVAADSSGRGNHGTLVNGPVWTSAGVFNGALSFDGIDDHVRVASPTPSMRPTNAFAMSAWVKYTTTDTSGSSEVATMANSYGLRVRSTGEVSAYFASAPGAWNFATTIGAGLNDGTWHHVVGQYTGSALQVYVDGVFNHQESFSGAIAYGLGTSFYLGQHNNSTNYNFNGTLDEVRSYGRALSASEIADLANPGSGPDPAEIKVVQWNVEGGIGELSAESAAIVAQQPDIVFLEEIDSVTHATAHETALEQNQDVEWHKVTINRNNTNSGSSFLVILTRFPFWTTPADKQTTSLADEGESFSAVCPGHPTPIVARAAIGVTINIEGKPVAVFATRNQQSAGNCVIAEQNRRFKNFANSNFPNVTHLYGGDFNMVPGSSPYNVMTVNLPKSVDAWEEARLAQPPTATAFGQSVGFNTATREDRQTGNLTNRLDYLFYKNGSTSGPELSVKSAHITESQLPNSDHRMMTAIFRVQP